VDDKNQITGKLSDSDKSAKDKPIPTPADKPDKGLTHDKSSTVHATDKPDNDSGNDKDSTGRQADPKTNVGTGHDVTGSGEVQDRSEGQRDRIKEPSHALKNEDLSKDNSEPRQVQQRTESQERAFRDVERDKLVPRNNRDKNEEKDIEKLVDRMTRTRDFFFGENVRSREGARVVVYRLYDWAEEVGIKLHFTEIPDAKPEDKREDDEEHDVLPTTSKDSHTNQPVKSNN
jgi:hypothetical protein